MRTGSCWSVIFGFCLNKILSDSMVALSFVLYLRTALTLLTASVYAPDKWWVFVFWEPVVLPLLAHLLLSVNITGEFCTFHQWVAFAVFKNRYTSSSSALISVDSAFDMNIWCVTHWRFISRLVLQLGRAVSLDGGLVSLSFIVYRPFEVCWSHVRPVFFAETVCLKIKKQPDNRLLPQIYLWEQMLIYPYFSCRKYNRGFVSGGRNATLSAGLFGRWKRLWYESLCSICPVYLNMRPGIF